MHDALIANWVARIDDTLDALIALKPCLHQKLYEAARYSLFSGGKRIRPLLTLAITHALHGEIESALFPACAIECIHTYSLIHDDLPCMDDDDFRRGKPTLHKVYSEGQAVLVGDYLLTFAFECLTKAPLLSAEEKIALISLFSEAAGGDGMVGGQLLDICPTPNASLMQIHRMKTGALFHASVKAGGIITKASTPTLESLSLLGHQIGFLFQIVDDILDNDHAWTDTDVENATQAIHHTLDSLPATPTILLHLINKILAPLLKPQGI